MTARLVILLVAAAGLAVAFAMRSSAPAPPDDEEPTFVSDADGQDLEDIRARQTPLVKRPLPGEEPPVPPDLSVEVDVDPTGTKNRLYFYITEAHGYYVEGFRLQVWYRTDDSVHGPEESPLILEHHIHNKYLEANGTLVACMDFVKPELDRIGGDIGTSDNWEARVVWHGRARLENPDPLPLIDEDDRCDPTGL